MDDIKKKYYLGGYYLVRLIPKTQGDNKGTMIYTASTCINENIVDI